MTMTKDEVRQVAQQVILEDRLERVKEAEENRDQKAKQLDDAMLKAVWAILIGFGFEEDERKETAKDFRFMRGLRLFMGKFAMIIITAGVSILVGGIGGIFYLGFQAIKALPK